MSPEKLVSKLKQQNLNIALAESCSAGYASSVSYTHLTLPTN